MDAYVFEFITRVKCVRGNMMDASGKTAVLRYVLIPYSSRSKCSASTSPTLSLEGNISKEKCKPSNSDGL